jgi:hypothetical protein
MSETERHKFWLMNGDDIAAGVGGSILAIVTSINIENTISVMFFACAGGFAGVFAKRLGEQVLNYITEKFNKYFKSPNSNDFNEE